MQIAKRAEDPSTVTGSQNLSPLVPNTDKRSANRVTPQAPSSPGMSIAASLPTPSETIYPIINVDRATPTTAATLSVPRSMAEVPVTCVNDDEVTDGTLTSCKLVNTVFMRISFCT